MKKIKIVKYASDICWWMGCLGQECDAIEYHKPPESKFHVVRIKVKKTDPTAINNPHYEMEGYISFDCVEVIE